MSRVRDVLVKIGWGRGVLAVILIVAILALIGQDVLAGGSDAPSGNRPNTVIASSWGRPVVWQDASGTIHGQIQTFGGLAVLRRTTKYMDREAAAAALAAEAKASGTTTAGLQTAYKNAVKAANTAAQVAKK